MHSINKVDDNILKIGKLFPNCLTERINEKGEVEYAIDFDVLRQELSPVIVEGNEERYQFTWPDKKKSLLLANAPIAKTLRPCREESVDFDNTENLYIEGDNLDVLKLLQETYLGKIKMIYIDPPYNTGNDFVYEDDFAQSTEEYLANSGQFDEEGNRLVSNNESNGRFHTDWLNMIYPRLKVAKELLADDGVIFISIDDNEVENIKKISDEIFGENNFVTLFIWKRRSTSALTDNGVSVDHEYVLSYTKKNIFTGIKKDFKNYSNPDNDPKGPYVLGDLTVGMTASMRPNQAYDLINPKTGIVYPFNPNRVWSYIPESMDRLISENSIYFPDNVENRPMKKRYKSELKTDFNPISSILIDQVGLNTEATRIIQNVMGGNIFDYSKPISLLTTLIPQVTNKDSLILDFFSGSSTTAHAVMKLNAEDGGNRKFIMVQLPEETEEKSEAFKAGYKNICEIGKERIRRAGKKIKDEVGLTAQNLDTGFRVLKLDSTNMKDVYYNPNDYEATLFASLADNIKADRTPEDLLFQVMLDLGVLLSCKIEEQEINGKNVFNVADGYLIACFDENVTAEIVKAIAMQKPYYFVMRDSSLADDSVATNFEQLFATYSPDTIRKVL